MEEVRAYKSKNGKLYHTEEEALEADREQMFSDFLDLVDANIYKPSLEQVEEIIIFLKTNSICKSKKTIDDFLDMIEEEIAYARGGN